MKTPNHRLALGALALFLAALFTAYPCNATQQGSELCISKPVAEGLRPLQGTWEGTWEEAGVGDQPPVKSPEKITITITGNSLHYHRNTNFWFATTFTLPAGTEPKQLHATIKDSASKDSLGTVVVAIFKIEDGTLTLATGNGDGEAPKSFEAAPNRYELKKVQSLKKNGEPSKSK
jgi:uncharacterized protein (TIGR03067 family)